MNGYIEINSTLCKGCELCIFFCPKKVISAADKLNDAGYMPAKVQNKDDCTGCAICALVCPEVAIEVFRD